MSLHSSPYHVTLDFAYLMNEQEIQSPEPGASIDPATGHKLTRDFYRVAVLGSALSFGILGATLESLHSSVAGFGFDLDWGTAIAFVVGFALTLLYWKLVLQNARVNRRASWVLALVGIVLFLYPLRFIPKDRLPDMAEGLVLAAIALGGAGSLIYMVGKNLLDEDDNNP